MERAVVITFNWETEETLHTKFEGPDAALDADQFKRAMIQSGDFPEPKWSWFMYANDSARERAAAEFIAAMMEDGGRT